MGKPVINIEELTQMLEGGQTGADCARHFGVSPAAVSKARKRLTRAVVRHTAAEKAPEIIDKTLDTFDQLKRINDDAKELLDVCMRWERGEPEALRIMESQVRYINVGSRDEPNVVEEYKFKDPRELAVKLMAEIRHQLDLQAKIFKQLFEMREVKVFMDVVIEVVEGVSPELRDRIIAEFKRRQLVRSAFSIH